MARHRQSPLQVKAQAERNLAKLEADKAAYLENGGTVQQADITERTGILTHRQRAELHRSNTHANPHT